MTFIRELVDCTYGHPLNSDTDLPYRINLSGCTNLHHIDDEILLDGMRVVRMLCTVYLNEPVETMRYRTPWVDKYYELRFEDPKDAMRIKLMMRF